MKFNGLLIFSCCCLALPARAIPDVEPDVTAQVADVLEGLANGTPSPERFTEKGASYLAVPGLSAALRGCSRPLKLELLSRNVNGEDRLYVYRAHCQPTALRIAIDFNKAARINRLEMAPER
ncbi:hypothetical protein GTP41_17780 [Pseudoduganella sp. DS3]|uniref:Uncharacterized protein n=1 Tax=Pseudoduganella guangdongensis TaxID=2692179 RepID=A0A6N9HJZ4_9BURK|nr:hypothetical protein [Pseudoduganella guangdongensis]MYN03948.1 hypothetical protein [Pseudoduganella guangdongensis]